jgi:hypothetical protein
MARLSLRLLSFALLSALLSTNPASAQSGSLESRMSPGVTLPQTAWIKAEVLGDSTIERGLRDKVHEILRLHGFVPEPFSPYAVRIELRGAGVQPVDAVIPQYVNAPARLSLWNSATAPDMVTVSLTLYHQSSGRVYWQAEGVCRNLDAASIPGSMIVPMMDQLGRNTKTSLSCTRLT